MPEGIPEVRTKGIDRSVAPHLIGPEKWYDSLNMRFDRGDITMIQPKQLLYRVGTTHRGRITAIVALPIREGGRSYHLVFMPGNVYYKTALGLASHKKLVGDNNFSVGDDTERWSTCVHGGKCYFSNLSNQIAYTDGGRVIKLTNSPRAKYVESFYDHIIGANVVQNGASIPYRMVWNDVRRINEWTPSRHNEADYYDCLDSAHESQAIGGITGLKRLGNALTVYTGENIYESQYVGLPRVMITQPKYYSIGSDFPYGLVSGGDAHFFPNLKYRNFFMYTGAFPQAIGNEIAEYFFNDLHGVPRMRDMTWGYIDSTRNEVIWCYVSKNSPAFTYPIYDKAVIYNVRERSWYPASVEDTSAYIDATLTARTFAEMAGLTVEQIPIKSALQVVPQPRLWGSSFGHLMSEIAVGDTGSVAIPRPTPYLESPDFIYSGLPNVSEVESLIIHGKTDTAIEVRTSVRDNLKDAVTFVKQQDWTAALPEKRVTTPRVAGKIIRYKFQPRVDTGSTTYNLAPPLFVNMGSKPSKDYELIVDANHLPLEGRFDPKYPGSYYFNLIGAGGGGGGRALVGFTAASTCPENATHKLLPLHLPVSQILSQNHYGALRTVYLNAYSRTAPGAFPVFVDNALGGGDPNVAVHIETAYVMYQDLLEQVQRAIQDNGDGPTHYVCLGWEKFTAGGQGVPFYTQYPVFPSVALPAAYWRMFLTYAYHITASERPKLMAAGGSGAYFNGLLNVRLQAGIVQPITYDIGTCPNHTFVGSAGQKGANGKGSYLTNSVEGYEILAGGGTGGGDNGFGGVDDGLGGAPSLTDPNVLVTPITQQSGDNAITEDPITGPVVTTPAQGGRAVTDTGVRTYRAKPEAQGTGYSQGGAGQRFDFKDNLSGTSGGTGRLRLTYRIIDGVAYPGREQGIPATVILRPIATNQNIKVASVTVPGAGLFNVVMRVKAVCERNQFSGGATLSDYLHQGGNPVFGTRSTISLVVNGVTYWLNHKRPESGALTASCEAFEYTHTIQVLGGGAAVLTFDSEDFTHYEPRDPSGNDLDYREMSDLPDSQWLVVELDPNVAGTNPRELSFSAFVPNVRKAGSEQ